MIYNDAIGTVRLSGGIDKTVGRVEVNLKGLWDTVCDYQFSDLSQW